jgi:hypothetical protein
MIAMQYRRQFGGKALPCVIPGILHERYAKGDSFTSVVQIEFSRRRRGNELSSVIHNIPLRDVFMGGFIRADRRSRYQQQYNSLANCGFSS